jgi:hypothetical protein
MACQLTDEILMSGDAGSSSLLEHAASCPDCEEVLMSLRSARAYLASVSPVPTPEARVRVRAALDRGIEAPERRSIGALRPSLGFSLGFMTGAAALVAVVLVARGRVPAPALEPSPEAPSLVAGELTAITPPSAERRADPLPLSAASGSSAVLPKNAWLKMKPNASLAIGHGRLMSKSETMLYLPEAPEPEAVEVLLERGEISATVAHLDRGQTFSVVTHQATFQVIGTRFTVRAERDTSRVEVAEGVVSVWPADAAEPMTVFAGQSLTVGKPAHETLALARAALPSDAPRAAELAEGVLEQRPSLPIEAEALAILADAQRRAGKSRLAAETYQKVAQHQNGRAFAEEALLQRATLLRDLGESDGAKAALDLAAERFADGPLAPERTALLARLLLDEGRIKDAADAIERAPKGALSVEVLERRLEVGRALLPLDPARAKALLSPNKLH